MRGTAQKPTPEPSGGESPATGLAIAPPHLAAEGLQPVPLGSSLGKFRVISILGHGISDILYEADDTVRQRRVALRQLPSALGREPAAMERLTAQADVIARL